MQLGAFSVSLAVRDLEASRTFYEKLGFEVIGGDAEQNWLILQNGPTILGLFEGILDKNILTFNPGWDGPMQESETFDDVRDIQRRLREQGIEPVSSADESTTGPESCMVVDPDGNPILIDQHR